MKDLARPVLAFDPSQIKKGGLVAVVFVGLIIVIAGILLFTPDLRDGWRAFRRMREAGALDRDAISEALEERLKPPPIEELEKTKVWGLSQLRFVLGLLSFLYMTPIVLLRFGLIFRTGVRTVWRLPVSFFELWNAFVLTMAFVYAGSGRHIAAFVHAGIVIVVVLERLGEQLTKSGRVRLINLPIHKLGIGEILSDALAAVVGFGAVYYTLSELDPAAFSSALGPLDAIYFSFITAATVGYGDITPVGSLPRILVLVESALALVFIVVVLNFYLNTIFTRTLAASQESLASEEPPAGGSSGEPQPES